MRQRERERERAEEEGEMTEGERWTASLSLFSSFWEVSSPRHLVFISPSLSLCLRLSEAFILHRLSVRMNEGWRKDELTVSHVSGRKPPLTILTSLCSALLYSVCLLIIHPSLHQPLCNSLKRERQREETGSDVCVRVVRQEDGTKIHQQREEGKETQAEDDGRNRWC